MEKGDLGTWVQNRVIVVIEAVLCTPKYERKLLRKHLTDPDQWNWSLVAIKSIVDRMNRLNSPVDLITYLGDDFRDTAADWLERYDVPVSSIASVDFGAFTESLKWRPEVMYVFDDDPDRIAHYGQKGYLVQGEVIF